MSHSFIRWFVELNESKVNIKANETMKIVQIYHYLNVEVADPRTNDWWLISSPFPLAIILLSYFYLVFVGGPRYMKDRKPYSLKTYMTCYNIFQIIYNTWLNHKIATGGWLTHLTLACEPVDYSLNPMSVQLAEAFWSTFILKLIDLSETAVFVFRKKDKQISFLHVYHHVSMLLLTWVGTKYYAGGMLTLSLMLNNTVHVIMYTYYLLSARGPRVRALVSFVKPYITIIQIVQFCLLLPYASQALPASCDLPTKGACAYIANLLMNLFFFTNFYIRNYRPSKKTV